MKYAVAATAFLFTLARAQDGLTDVISQIPTCALNCLTQGISGAGCGLDDFECTCSNFESISNDVQPCLGNSECTDTEAADTVRLAANLCNSIGSESASVTVTTATPTGSETGSETPSNLETIPVASETETLTTTVGSETVTVSSSSEESGSVTTTVTDASETTTATESETTTASGSDASASDASGSDAAASESGSEGDDDSAAGRVQAAGWAVAGVIAAAIAL